MIVLDCSAAVAMALGTEEGHALGGPVLDGELIVAPSLFHAELSNALSKYAKAGYLSNEQAQEKGSYALSLVDQFYEDRELYAEVLAKSIRLKHSSYDLFYLVLAKRCAATLFTLDKSLAFLCDQQGVQCVQEVAL